MTFELTFENLCQSTAPSPEDLVYAMIEDLLQKIPAPISEKYMCVGVWLCACVCGVGVRVWYLRPRIVYIL